MSIALLKTKLFIPPARADLVPRPRLGQRLSAGLGHLVTSISAPAGFGKTTLLSEWHESAEGHDIPLGWLALDEDDNDFVRFMMYLVGALERVNADAGDDAVALLQSIQTPSPK